VGVFDAVSRAARLTFIMIRIKAVTEIPLRFYSFYLRFVSRSMCRVAAHWLGCTVCGRGCSWDDTEEGAGGASRRWRRRRRRSSGGGESFLRVYWVAVPQAVRARRANDRGQGALAPTASSVAPGSVDVRARVSAAVHGRGRARTGEARLAIGGTDHDQNRKQ
jgi:hypothetical protein